MGSLLLMLVRVDGGWPCARLSCGVVPSCHALPCHPALGVSVEHQCRVRGFLYARLALAERSADIAFLSQRSACPMTPSPLTCARAWAFLRVPSGATTPQRSGRCSKTRVSIPPCLCPSDGSHRSSRHRKVVWLSPLPSFGLWQQPEARRLGAIQSHSESLRVACLRVTQCARIGPPMMQFVTSYVCWCRHVVRRI